MSKDRGNDFLENVTASWRPPGPLRRFACQQPSLLRHLRRLSRLFILAAVVPHNEGSFELCAQCNARPTLEEVAFRASWYAYYNE